MTKEEKGHNDNFIRETKIKGNSLGASGFTLGILSILFSGYFGLIMSLIGVTLCIVQQKNKKTKLGFSGMILNIIGLILSILFIAVIAPYMAKLISSSTA